MDLYCYKGHTMKRKILFLVLMPVLSFATATTDLNTQKLINTINWSKSDDDQSAQKVARLLAAGANAYGIQNRQVDTPLYEAVGKGFTKIVKVLLPYYKDTINLRNSNRMGETVLSRAVFPDDMAPKVEIVTMLLNAGADPKIPNMVTGDPLINSVSRHIRFSDSEEDRESYLKIEKLLKDYSDISPESIVQPTPETLEKAIKVGATSLVQQLMTQLKPTREILEIVITLGSIDLVKQLLPELNLTAEQLSSFGQKARSRFEETKNPVYKEIGRLLYEQVKKIRSLVGTTQGGKGTHSPVEIATTIVNPPAPLKRN